jgi:hypothetical protein
VYTNCGCPSTLNPKVLDTVSSVDEIRISCITNTYPEAASSVQQVYKVLSDIEILAGSTPAKVREISGWTSIVKSAEEDRENFCNGLDEKTRFSALNCMYTMTLNEMKVVLQSDMKEHVKEEYEFRNSGNLTRIIKNKWNTIGQ